MHGLQAEFWAELFCFRKMTGGATASSKVATAEGQQTTYTNDGETRNPLQSRAVSRGEETLDLGFGVKGKP